MGRGIISIVVLVAALAYSGERYFPSQSREIEQHQGSIIDEDSHYKIIDRGNFIYEYMIFDNKGNIVMSDESYGIPAIGYIEPDMIVISLSAGTEVYFCTYYDTKNNLLSEQYTSPIATEYGRIAYFDYKEELCPLVYPLVICDIFNKENVMLREYLPDISPVVGPIKSAYFIDQNSFYISYQSGEMQEEKSATLSFD